MTDWTGGRTDATEGAADPFVTQVAWLIAASGGKDQLVARSGNRVSARTLDNWTAGVYPRHKVTGAVRDLDAWALANVPGYPAAAGVPRLTDSCGPYRAPVTSGAGKTESSGATPAVEAGTTRKGLPRVPRRRLRWALAGAVLVVVAAASVVATLVIDDAQDAKAVDPIGAAESVASAPLPSTGDGKLRVEQSGSIGANTFADPRTLIDRALPIPPHTTVMVRCRYYAPSIPSVTPDGFWYLIDSGQWAGRWTPANSYMNGDVPGGPTLHNTDMAVPVCK
jgi:hypothetical protein